MDPQACLIAADQALSDGELEQCAQHLADYTNWRRKSGYQPEVYGKPGDIFHREVRARLDDAITQRNRARWDDCEVID